MLSACDNLNRTILNMTKNKQYNEWNFCFQSTLPWNRIFYSLLLKTWALTSSLITEPLIEPCNQNNLKNAVCKRAPAIYTLALQKSDLGALFLNAKSIWKVSQNTQKAWDFHLASIRIKSREAPDSTPYPAELYLTRCVNQVYYKNVEKWCYLLRLFFDIFIFDVFIVNAFFYMRNEWKSLVITNIGARCKEEWV